MMNKENARATLKQLLQPLKTKTHAEFESLVGSEIHREDVTEPDGSQYQCKVRVCWADYPPGHITVYGLAGRFPRTVSEAFTISPENKITNEESH